MRIATIGAGRMGSALGALFVKAGHEVMFSSRNPDELKDMVAALGPKAKAGTVAEAVAFGEVVFLLVPYGAMPEVAKAHASALAKKSLVLDVSNPILPRDGAVGEQARKEGPGTFLAGLMLGVPLAGDDAKALEMASTLVRDVGFEPVVVGNLAFGRHLLPGAPLGGPHSPAELKQIAGKLK
jgi:predicted dinucleotide-binding enzyme